MKMFFSKSLSIAVIAFIFINATIWQGCQPISNENCPDKESSDDCMSFTKLKADLKTGLEGRCVGYAYIVSYKGTVRLEYSNVGGLKRTTPELKYGFFDRSHIASVSKEITAMAVIKLLDEKGLNLETKVSAYLPANWVKGENVNKLTFRRLLTHRSGLTAATPYLANLKTTFEIGIPNSADTTTQSYANSNFAVFRYIIPRLLGKNPITDEGYTAEYLAYCQTKIFTPCNIANVKLKTEGTEFPLSYSWPADSFVGTDFGDATLSCGSEGFVLSVTDLANIQNKLWYSESILSTAQRNRMRDNALGLWNNGSLTKGTKFYGHNGFYPYSGTQGLLWSQIMHLENGVDIALLVNSPISADGGAVTTDANGVTGLHPQSIILNALNAAY